MIEKNTSFYECSCLSTRINSKQAKKIRPSICTQRHFISKFNKNKTKLKHRTMIKWDYSCSILKFNIATTKNYESCRKVMQEKKYSDRNSYRCSTSSCVCNIHVYVFLHCTIVRTLYYFTTESWELLYILPCPVATTCEKRVFSTIEKK